MADRVPDWLKTSVLGGVAVGGNNRGQLKLLNTLMRKCQRFWEDFHGQSSQFRDYERVILDMSGDALEPELLQCLKSQMSRLRLVQRSHKDRVLLTFFRKDVVRYSENGWVEILRGKLKAIHSKERPVNFRVWMWDGLPLKIEFSRSPRFLDGTEVEVIHTPKPWKRRKELTDILDRQEHGPNPELADAEDDELQRS